jgi:hypothetical protein
VCLLPRKHCGYRGKSGYGGGANRRCANDQLLDVAVYSCEQQRMGRLVEHELVDELNDELLQQLCAVLCLVPSHPTRQLKLADVFATEVSCLITFDPTFSLAALVYMSSCTSRSCVDRGCVAGCTLARWHYHRPHSNSCSSQTRDHHLLLLWICNRCVKMKRTTCC